MSGRRKVALDLDSNADNPIEGRIRVAKIRRQLASSDKDREFYADIVELLERLNAIEGRRADYDHVKAWQFGGKRPRKKKAGREAVGRLPTKPEAIDTALKGDYGGPGKWRAPKGNLEDRIGPIVQSGRRDVLEEQSHGNCKNCGPLPIDAFNPSMLKRRGAHECRKCERAKRDQKKAELTPDELKARRRKEADRQRRHRGGKAP